MLSIDAGAQEVPRLTPGVPVRLLVRTPGGPRAFVGGLVVLGADSVSILRGPRPEAFALRNLDRFEINRGRPRAVMVGAPMLGAAIGALFGATALARPAGCQVAPADEQCAWETAPVIVGTAGGAVLFALVVNILVPEIWQEVPLAVLIGGGPPGSGAPSPWVGLRIHR